ncbi:hypothetical protein AYO49_00090 [Verrucomicrobiaceae bacterium SCGC AG-212-N21]|nr:hypothetical protein AYO49_00090 [Verrucomicrobiaceae bacterium SCGC AG-212-N21]
MSLEVTWTWAAEVDAQEAFARLEEFSEGAGVRFTLTLDRLLVVLRRFPLMAAMWRKPVRRAIIRRSQYGLYYVVEPTRLVVIAVLDLRRDPEKLEAEVLKRLP